MPATLERHETAEGVEQDEWRKARVLLGGTWFDIEYMVPDDDGEPLQRIIMRAAGMPGAPIDVLPVRWGWTSGAREGHLILHNVEGIADDGHAGMGR